MREGLVSLINSTIKEPLASDVLRTLEGPFDRSDLLDLDGRFSGWGFSNVDDPITGRGRYAVADRSIYRGFQHARLIAGSPTQEGYMRYLVSNMGGHLEAVVERLAEQHATHREGATLGENLHRLRGKLPVATFEAADALRVIWNEAKHDWDHPKDTHLFTPGDAWRFYFAARAVGQMLLPDSRPPEALAT